MTSIAIAAPRFLASTLGKKVVMAVTGAILFGFAIGHMLGNLQVYLGPEVFNHYAETLKGTPILLWGVRTTLLVSVILHIIMTAQLARIDRKARPVGYKKRSWREASYASRTMYLSGPIVAAFLIYHILHFTTGHAHPEFVEGDAYRNFVTGFQNPLAAGAYVIAMLMLWGHLQHGAFSLFQSLGLRNPRYSGVLRKVTTGVASVVVIANILFPIMVQAGVVRL